NAPSTTAASTTPRAKPWAPLPASISRPMPPRSRTACCSSTSVDCMTGMVIIGAGMAGHRAVIGLRAAGHQGAITLIGEETWMPYDRPPLSKSALTAEAEPLPVWLMDEDIAKSLKAETRCGVSVVHIDRTARTVRLSDASTIPYAKL